MSIRKTRRHAFLAMIFGGVLLSGLLVSTFAMAQSFQLEDMMGMWATKSSNAPGYFIYHVYQATTGPASLTLRYVRDDNVPSLPPGASGTSTNSDLYQLTVNDRSLSGTYTVDTSILASLGKCASEKRTFPVQGRISPDGNTITIVHNHDWPTIFPCGWNNSGESVTQIERYH